VQVLPDYATSARPMHVVYHADRYSNPKLRCFVDFVVERFGRAA
jgi:DNA-binding transcriptional LysR family regulator